MSIYIQSKTILLMIGISLFLVTCAKPDFYLMDGSKGQLSDLKGKWVVVNYWADWCPPCIKEMPELTSFYNHNRGEVMVFAYNFDRLEGQILEEQIIRFKVNVPSILTDPGDLFGWEAPSNLPATFILDPEGNLKEMLIGPQTEEKLEKIIKEFKES
ncbi:MAG: TlpA family protein disulfide reductase [SAR86 cluster bacterium]|nr:TlpA family protein disulfide reductase [SAR86 cluster bacterium]